jgi:hypothetical protein
MIAREPKTAISAKEFADLEAWARSTLKSVRKMPPGKARRDALAEASALHARTIALRCRLDNFRMAIATLEAARGA